MESYHINDLVQLTGIKAHTIRIWEKRYNLITPLRSDTNRRCYNDSQVKKLLNVSTLLTQGHKISRIAALTDDEISKALLSTAETDNQTSAGAAFINDLVKSMLNFDESAFDKVLSAAVTHFGMHHAMINVVYPFLHKTGILWTADKTVPAQEHFASCIIRRKLLSAIDGLPPATGTKKFLLFLPDGEWHEISLLLADYLLRLRGCHTVYLGQNVPLENVRNVYSKVVPSHILLFFIATGAPDHVEETIRTVAAFDQNVQVLYSGSVAIAPSDKNTIRNATYLSGVDSLFDHV